MVTLALTHPVLCRADRCDPLSTSNRRVNLKYIPDVVNPGEIEEPISCRRYPCGGLIITTTQIGQYLRYASLHIEKSMTLRLQKMRLRSKGIPPAKIPFT